MVISESESLTFSGKPTGSALVTWSGTSSLPPGLFHVDATFGGNAATHFVFCCRVGLDFCEPTDQGCGAGVCGDGATLCSENRAHTFSSSLLLSESERPTGLMRTTFFSLFCSSINAPFQRERLFSDAACQSQCSLSF